MLVSLAACAGKLTRNLINLLVYAGWLWICKITCLYRSVLMHFFSECRCELQEVKFFGDSSPDPVYKAQSATARSVFVNVPLDMM